MWCRLLHLIHVCKKSFSFAYVEFVISEKFVTTELHAMDFENLELIFE